MPSLTERFRWEIVYVRSSRLHRINCGDDFHEALRLYRLAIESEDRTHVTLRSCNIGFPPPAKYRPRLIEFEKPRRTRDGRVITAGKLNPMLKLNRQGVWWCPFCVKLRRFKYERGRTTQDGIYIGEPRMACPVCAVGHTSFDVRMWNPLAAQMFYGADVRDPTKPRRYRRRKRKEEDE